MCVCGCVCVCACVCMCMGLVMCGCVYVFFLNKFIHNTLHYTAILHVLVYTLLDNDFSIAVW